MKRGILALGLIFAAQSLLAQDWAKARLNNSPRHGEWVQIKSEPEIAQTCDTRARNRGLTCDLGMRQYCGGQYQVRNRLDRMILEPTGEMRQVESTVILEGINCLCWWNHVGGCPRSDYVYWREIWLERAGRRTAEEVEVACRPAAMKPSVGELH